MPDLPIIRPEGTRVNPKWDDDDEWFELDDEANAYNRRSLVNDYPQHVPIGLPMPSAKKKRRKKEPPPKSWFAT